MSALYNDDTLLFSAAQVSASRRKNHIEGWLLSVYIPNRNPWGWVSPLVQAYAVTDDFGNLVAVEKFQ